MARKKTPNSKTKVNSVAKDVDTLKKNINTDLDYEPDPDISKLRRMPTDDLMSVGDESKNLKKSNQSRLADKLSINSKTNSRSKVITASKEKENSGTQLEFRHKSQLHSFAGLTSFEKSKLLKSKASTSKAVATHEYSKMNTVGGFPSHAIKMMKNKRDFSVVKKPSVSSKKSLTKITSSRIVQKKVSSIFKSNNNLWFPKDAVLAVRTVKKDEFYLCRTRMNVYNYTSEVKINWFVNKAKNFKIPNSYKMGYRDVIDTASILMQVNINRLSRVTYQLPSDQVNEIMKLLSIAQDVERGEKTVDQLGDDVERVVLVDKPAPKKPRLQKTASQKLIVKERKAGRKKEPKVDKKTGQKKKKDGNSEPKRKKPSKKVTIKELHPRPDIKVLDLDPLFETREPVPYVSKVANSRLIYRAIYLKDNKLLTKLLKDGSTIYKLYSKSLTEKEYIADAAGKANDKNILLTLLEEFFGKKFSDRCKNNTGDPNLLDKLETGK
ncbi:hypothetical protein Btru_073633 [Bulinus truncatus]|nr:hypothetical protein Btru_073633 [Bulinus truncatus]